MNDLTIFCYRYFTSLEGEAGLRPDMKFYTTIDRIRFDCLLIEVKCPNSTCEDDLFKLSIEMQYILNRFVEHGANNPIVFGVLIYGKQRHECCLCMNN
jgi:hypothetical protein